jgi:hypothetical protein
MKAEKYLESIGLEDVKDTEFFNDDDKSWYKLPELMEEYHQAKLDLGYVKFKSNPIVDPEKVIISKPIMIREDFRDTKNKRDE